MQLGEPSISFNIFFHDIFQNLTNLFKGNVSHVILTCECKDAQNYNNKLKIKGMKNKYKPDSNGEVKGMLLSKICRNDVRAMSMCNVLQSFLLLWGEVCPIEFIHIGMHLFKVHSKDQSTISMALLRYLWCWIWAGIWPERYCQLNIVLGSWTCSELVILH